MHNLFHKSILLLSLIVAAWGCHADTEVLWWMVNYGDDADWYDKDNLITVRQLPGAEDLEARIRYDNGSGDSGYLNFWMLDDQTPPHAYPDDGTGMTSWGLEIDGYADVTGKATYSFTIELGNFTEPQNENSWVAIVTGETRSYDTLANNIGTFNAQMEYAGNAGFAWTTSYAVPEPNSGLLLLLGGALLALRRRRNGRSG